MRLGLTVTFICLLTGVFSVAQDTVITATTENGKKVLLAPDGTWKYVPEINTLSASKKGGFVKGEKATKTISLNKDACLFSYDPQVWKLENDDGPRYFTFQMKNGDAYGKIVAERIELPIDTLRELAITNANKIATSSSITNEGHIEVNGKDLLFMQFDAVISGATFTFLGAYYSGPEGIVQILAWTSKNLVDEYKEECLRFISGFEVPEKKA